LIALLMSKQEDEKLLQLYTKMGSRWAAISEHGFSGARTDADCLKRHRVLSSGHANRKPRRKQAAKPKAKPEKQMLSSTKEGQDLHSDELDDHQPPPTKRSRRVTATCADKLALTGTLEPKGEDMV